MDTTIRHRKPSAKAGMGNKGGAGLTAPPRAAQREERFGTVDSRVLSAPASLAEEQALMEAGWLPPEYVKARGRSRAAAEALAMRPGAPARSMSYTDPAVMLRGARTLAGTPELQELARTVRKGDIVLTAEFLPGAPVTGMTGGPYNHAMICVKEGPQAEFIEAIGVTGGKADPTGNRVRQSRIQDYAIRHIAFRVLRPGDAPPPAQREAAISRAVEYARQQLGRPYDYAFTNLDHGKGGEKAFYCSELVYMAWSSKAGAGIRMPVARDASLNVGVRAIHAVLDTAGPVRPNETLRPIVRQVMDGRHPLAISQSVLGGVVPKLRGPDLKALGEDLLAKATGRPADPRFVSPTDLAWGGLPVLDFNTKGRQMDPAARR
jgi:hypothetical protein